MSNVQATGEPGRDKSIQSSSNPTPDTELPNTSPPLAIRSDGRLLVSIDAFANRDTTGRETWTGVAVTADEEAFLLGRCEHAAHEAASRVAGLLPVKKKA